MYLCTCTQYNREAKSNSLPGDQFNASSYSVKSIGQIMHNSYKLHSHLKHSFLAHGFSGHRNPANKRQAVEPWSHMQTSLHVIRFKKNKKKTVHTFKQLVYKKIRKIIEWKRFFKMYN